MRWLCFHFVTKLTLVRNNLSECKNAMSGSRGKPSFHKRDCEHRNMVVQSYNWYEGNATNTFQLVSHELNDYEFFFDVQKIAYHLTN